MKTGKNSKESLKSVANRGEIPFFDKLTISKYKIYIPMTTVYYYPAKSAIVSTPNLDFAQIKARKIMQRGIVRYKLSDKTIAKFKPKFAKK